MNIKIELNEQFQNALDLMENTRKNIFITGKAGVGKSTLLNYFRERTKKEIAVLAPTGVSALNIQGETIHSFFGFKPDITSDKIKKLSERKSKIYKKIDSIVIDEISMVRADLLDYIDIFLRKNTGKQMAFGGIQMIFIGDLYQLPPVVKGIERDIFKTLYPSPYFFDSNIFKRIEIEFIELEKIYRQKDERFINILNAIRNNTIKEEQISELNRRVGAKIKDENYLVYLTPLNKEAKRINDEKLLSLNKEIKIFSARVEGNFDANSYPCDEELKVCEGCQIMFLNNDSQGRWVNGTLGIVKGFDFDEDTQEESIIVEKEDKEIVEVLPYSWEIFHYKFDEKNQKLTTQTVGIFRQHPLKLAWAVTIHKSQGKTYKNVSIDLKNGIFAPGQTYVALSRCISLDGISLKVPVKKSHILTDWRIVKFLTELQYKISEKEIPINKKEEIIEKAIEKGEKIEIVYLKKKDEKSARLIKPLSIEECEYKGYAFRGLRAYCYERKEERVFRLERILKLKSPI